MISNQIVDQLQGQLQNLKARKDKKLAKMADAQEKKSRAIEQLDMDINNISIEVEQMDAELADLQKSIEILIQGLTAEGAPEPTPAPAPVNPA